MGKTGTHMIFLKNIANDLPFHTLCFGGKLCLFYKGGKERAVVLILGKVSVLEKSNLMKPAFPRGISPYLSLASLIKWVKVASGTWRTQGFEGLMKWEWAWKKW